MKHLQAWVQFQKVKASIRFIKIFDSSCADVADHFCKADSSLTASRKPVKIRYFFCCFCQEIKDTFSICSKM